MVAARDIQSQTKVMGAMVVCMVAVVVPGRTTTHPPWGGVVQTALFGSFGEMEDLSHQPM
jgi:hypothetical protein